MADPMRIRANATGDKVLVKILMSHEMETGQRKDANGAIIPAWFIQTVEVRANDKIVLSAEWGPAVSKNPYLQFQYGPGHAGDKVQVTWVDNHGDTRTDELSVV